MSPRERVLWAGGRIFHLIPSGMPITIPAGFNKGFRWLRGAANAPEWMGIYERSKQEVVRRLDMEGKTVFDVGANAGYYTLAFSRMVGPKGSVFAFEPLGRNCEKILRHLSLNGIRNAQLVQCALSDENGFTGFATGNSDFEGRMAKEGRYLVPVSTIDTIVRNLIHDAPHLLKIDVEGAEAAVLRGARDLLSRRTATLMVALHGETPRSACFEILKSHGYRIEALDGTVVIEPRQMGDEILAMP